jgi:hypothetical protein
MKSYSEVSHQASIMSDKIKKTAKTNPPKQLEGCYINTDSKTVRLVLKDGRYQWGARDIHDFGTYSPIQWDEYSCTIELSSELFKGKPLQCQFTRRGKTYTVQKLASGEKEKFKREDGPVFLSDSLLMPEAQKQLMSDAANARKKNQKWKQIEDSDAAVSFYLTGESVIKAATFPAPPKSKTPTTVRITHSNVYGCVDSDIYVRLGDYKKPLDVQDFDTVSDWKKAKLVEDLVWSDKRREWVLKTKAAGDTSVWSGTYEVELQFPKGYQQIEFKIISRVPEVCSIVLSNWKVYVR